MNIRIGFALVAVIGFLSGCASTPQHPIEVSQNAFSAQYGRLGIAMTALPKIDTYFPGAGCLLCLGIASMANSSLTGYTHSLSYEELPNIKNDIADTLRKKGVNVTVISEDLNINSLPKFNGNVPNAAKKDFSSLKAKYNIDKLLVINIDSLGFIRTYADYIPTSVPKGVFHGVGYIVDLSSNTYGWYLPVDIKKSAEGDWDESPKFPGLTNAYYQALEIGRDSFLKPFSN
jgi:hypothetical protein